MKVLMTVEFYWPHLGGAEEVCRRIAEGLAKRGHEVHVATSVEAQRSNFSINGVHIHEFDIRGNEVKGFRGNVSAYRGFLRSFDCDVLFNYAAQSWTTDIAMQELPRVRARRRVLAACGYSGLSTPLRRLVYAAYFQRLPARLRRYDLLIYHSINFRDALFGEEHGISHMQIIANGVDADEFALMRGRFRAELGVGDRLLLVNVSNHYRLKGHDTFVKLASAVGNRAELALLGRDVAPVWQSCARSCTAHAASKGVRLFKGDRERVVQAIRDADLFVLTSRSEVAPLVLLEAAAAGTPWVSFDVGNARELKGGVVVGRDGDLATTINRLLDRQDERRQLGLEGHAFARQHDWELCIDEYEGALRRVLEPSAAVN